MALEDPGIVINTGRSAGGDEWYQLVARHLYYNKKVLVLPLFEENAKGKYIVIRCAFHYMKSPDLVKCMFLDFTIHPNFYPVTYF